MAKLSFLQYQIDNFTSQFKPSKRVTDDLKYRAGLDNHFAWDDARQRFIADYIQDAWEKWFGENGKIEWVEDATHFDYRTLDLLKIKNNEVAKWVPGVKLWLDITPYYLIDKDRLIAKTPT